MFAQSRSTTKEIISDSFEFGMGNWYDGGVDCEISKNLSSSGVYSIRLKGNSGQESSIYSRALNLEDKEEVKISFNYHSQSMELGEQLSLEISVDGGTSFETIRQWVSAKEFNDAEFRYKTLNVEYDFSKETVFRFRCIGSNFKDQIFLDEIEIKEVVKIAEMPFIGEEIALSQSSFNNDSDNIKIFPNPARDFFSLNLSNLEGQEGSIEIYNLIGSKLSRSIFKSDHPKIIDIPIDYLENGYYSVCVKTDAKKLHVLRLMVSR